MRVVIVGGGFGGLQAGLALRSEPIEITLVDRRNFHLFQPLTYQVATGSLDPGEIAYPLRTIFKRQRNIRTLLAEVTGFDLEARQLRLQAVAGVPVPASIAYDALIVAGGSSYSYFGHDDDWGPFAAEVKSLESAIVARSRILRAFEAAETEPEESRRAAWLTFVVVGGGPTGVEISGQIAELARDTLRREFRSSDPRTAQILLIETMDRPLTAFAPSLSKKAIRSLTRLGVTPMLGSTVVGVDGESVTVSDASGASKRIPTRTVVWAAGVTASPLAAQLAEQTGAELDRAGRMAVQPDLTLPGHPEVFAIGDMVRVSNGDGTVRTLPGLAPVAMQQGRYVAGVLRHRLRADAHVGADAAAGTPAAVGADVHAGAAAHGGHGRSVPPFSYHDKGNLATVGRGAAVAEIGRLRLSGVIAWLVWLVVHIWYLVGFQNRVVVLLRWSFSFVSHGRSGRVITETPTGAIPSDQ